MFCDWFAHSCFYSNPQPFGVALTAEAPNPQPFGVALTAEAPNPQPPFGETQFMEPQQQPSMQFLTLEESNSVDAALLSSPEKFLTRLTISSLRLLKHIAQENGVNIEDLTADQVVAWFEKDGKVRREQGIDAAYLKW